MNKIKVFTDGASKGNPGAAGIGIVLYDEHDNILEQYFEYLGKATNNQAEYSAILKSLDIIDKTRKSTFFDNVDFFSDSELMVKQIRGEYKIKNNGLKPLVMEFHNRVKHLNIKYTITHIKREFNKTADNLANKAINEAVNKTVSV